MNVSIYDGTEASSLGPKNQKTIPVADKEVSTFWDLNARDSALFVELDGNVPLRWTEPPNCERRAVAPSLRTLWDQ